jgi:hypothetical protein
MELPEIYDELGQKVLASLPDVDWAKAVLFIKRLEKNVGFNGEYFLSDGERVSMDIQMDYQTAKAVMKLHEITSTMNDTKWNRAVYTLNADHSFNLTFEWDQELQDRVDGYEAKNS